MSVKTSRLQLILPTWLKDRIRVAAEAKGITMSEYIKDAVKQALEKEKGDI